MTRFSVAVVVDSSSAFSQGVLRGITQYVFENGPWVISYEERALDSFEPTWLKSWDGDGIIIRTRTAQAARLALRTGAKVVDLGEQPLPGTPMIGINHVACSQKAAELLRQRRFDYFAFVGIESRPFSRFRLEAFRENLGAETPAFELPASCLRLTPSLQQAPLAEWLRALPKPCGIMACNDLAGNFVIQTCLNAGIQVPDEIAVVGVDNDPFYCQMAPVPMTSIELDTFRMGMEAAALLDRLMRGGQAPEVPFAISPLKTIERRSTDYLALSDPTVRRALSILRDQSCDSITVNQLAEQLGVSRRLLERRFAAVLKSTVRHEILRYQMARAEELLKGTTLTLDAIAKRAGFVNTAHFCTVFKRFFSKTPGSIR